MNFPSVKRIQSVLRVEPETAKMIRAFMERSEGRNATPAYPKPVLDWARSCYHYPTRRQKCMAAMAWILTEGRDLSWDVFQPQEEWDSFHDGPAWEAINLGDPYVPTIIRRNGRFRLGCWGDLPEVNR